MLKQTRTTLHHHPISLSSTHSYCKSIISFFVFLSKDSYSTVMATQTPFLCFVFLFFFWHIGNVALSSIQHTKAVFYAETQIQIKSFNVVKYTVVLHLGFKGDCDSEMILLFFGIVLIVYIIWLCCYFSFNILILFIFFFFFYSTSYTSRPIFFTLAYTWKLMCELFLLIALIRI